MNDKERWTLSFGGALLIYALLFTAAVFITIETRFETAAVAVELRLPSLPVNNGEKKSEQLPLRQSVSAAVRPAVAAVGQPAVNTESNASVPATTETGRGQIPSRVSADKAANSDRKSILYRPVRALFYRCRVTRRQPGERESKGLSPFG